MSMEPAPGTGSFSDRDFLRTKTYRKRATPEEDSAAVARSLALLGRLQYEVRPVTEAQDEPVESLESSIGWNIDPVTGRPHSV